MMARAPQHTFQVLTKRAERMQRLLTHPKMRGFVGDAPWPLPNVWIGVSVESRRVLTRIRSRITMRHGH